jgi:hypothetical protein
MEAIYSLETSVDFHWTTQFYVLKDRTIYGRHSENLKACIALFPCQLFRKGGFLNHKAVFSVNKSEFYINFFKQTEILVCYYIQCRHISTLFRIVHDGLQLDKAQSVCFTGRCLVEVRRKCGCLST